MGNRGASGENVANWQKYYLYRCVINDLMIQLHIYAEFGNEGTGLGER